MEMNHIVAMFNETTCPIENATFCFKSHYNGLYSQKRNKSDYTYLIYSSFVLLINFINSKCQIKLGKYQKLKSFLFHYYLLFS